MFTDIVTRKHMKVIKMWQGSNFSGYKFEQKSHSLGLQKSTANQIRLNETVVLDMWQPEMCFDRLEKQP